TRRAGRRFSRSVLLRPAAVCLPCPPLRRRAQKGDKDCRTLLPSYMQCTEVTAGFKKCELASSGAKRMGETEFPLTACGMRVAVILANAARMHLADQAIEATDLANYRCAAVYAVKVCLLRMRNRIQQIMPVEPDRIRVLNTAPERNGADYVLYWSQMNRRV